MVRHIANCGLNNFQPVIFERVRSSDLFIRKARKQMLNIFGTEINAQQLSPSPFTINILINHSQRGQYLFVTQDFTLYIVSIYSHRTILYAISIKDLLAGLFGCSFTTVLSVLALNA